MSEAPEERAGLGFDGVCPQLGNAWPGEGEDFLHHLHSISKKMGLFSHMLGAHPVCDDYINEWIQERGKKELYSQ